MTARRPILPFFLHGKPLAQALYKTVEVGDPIPSALYHAVAEILVLVFKAQSEVRDRDARSRRTVAQNSQAQRANVRPQ